MTPEKQYKTELHAHCAEVSLCSDVGAVDVADRYLAAGYDTLVLTNHFSRYTLNASGKNTWDEMIDYFLAPIKLMQEHVGDRMKILFGAELRFDRLSRTIGGNINDYLLYGITEEFMRAHPYFYEMDIKEFVPLAHENGILFFQAHPFRNSIMVTNPQLLDGVEIFNGHKGHESRNHIAALWAKQYGLIPTSGSDFHHPDSALSGGILTDEPVTDMTQLVELLRARNYTLHCSGPAAERDGMHDMPANY